VVLAAYRSSNSASNNVAELAENSKHLGLMKLEPDRLQASPLSVWSARLTVPLQLCIAARVATNLAHWFFDSGCKCCDSWVRSFWSSGVRVCMMLQFSGAEKGFLIFDC
jgi:hypothetical protein